MAGLAFAEPESTPEAEADPAADAWYGYYGHGYGYGGYGYGRRYYGGYYGHPYGYGYYRGKRDANRTRRNSYVPPVNETEYLHLRQQRSAQYGGYGGLWTLWRL